MVKSKNLYRGYAIDKVGHGKKAAFQTIINDKEWSAPTAALVKMGIDAWIDQGVEPGS